MTAQHRGSFLAERYNRVPELLVVGCLFKELHDDITRFAVDLRLHQLVEVLHNFPWHRDRRRGLFTNE